MSPTGGSISFLLSLFGVFGASIECLTMRNNLENKGVKKSSSLANNTRREKSRASERGGPKQKWTDAPVGDRAEFPFHVSSPLGRNHA